MRAAILLIGLSFGCAHQQQVASHPTSIVEDDQPAEPAPQRSVRLVAHRPPHYRFVGRVKASAPNDDFVLAAKLARAQLSKRAEALGADVIKIERVDPALHGQVLMAGRAYRLAD